MSEQTSAPETGDGVNTTATPNPAETDANAQPSLQAEKDRLEAEIAALKDKYLRAFAEAENVRRRADKEVADAKVYGIASFARDMLTVADDLSRALVAVDDEVKDKAEGPVKALLEGIEITERGLAQALEKHKIRRIEPRGEKFDPNLHQAMFEVPDPSVPSGTVVQVVQAGYVIGERVLRPALVGVARGGPKAEAPVEAKPEGEA